MYSDHFWPLLPVQVFFSIEPKPLWHLCRSVWSLSGLKQGYFDRQQRYMMLLLAAWVWSIQWQDWPITGHYWARGSTIKKGHCFSDKRTIMADYNTFYSNCSVYFEGTVNCIAYLAALMSSNFLLNPAFMLIKVSLVFCEFVTLSHYWGIIIYRPLACEGHHCNRFNHWVYHLMNNMSS